MKLKSPVAGLVVKEEPQAEPKRPPSPGAGVVAKLKRPVAGLVVKEEPKAEPKAPKAPGARVVW